MTEISRERRAELREDVQPIPHNPISVAHETHEWAPVEVPRCELRALLDYADEHDEAEARNRELEAALQEQRFIYYWRVEGMKVAQARIHADADIGRMRAQLAATAPPDSEPAESSGGGRQERNKLKSVRRYLTAITDLERVTRQGGAAPEDLSDLEWAVETAVQHASGAINELDRALAQEQGWLPEVTQAMVDEINRKEGWSGFTLEDLQDIRDAMLAAAPQPQEGESDG